MLRPLARGGNAEVFVVEDAHSGEHLALKLLTQLGTARPRFDREFEAMIRLNHPNIVRVYSYGLHEDMPWLTMELLAGTQLQAYIRDQGKPSSERRVSECVRLGADLARALDHIHRRGLVHRDLKSANVLVLPDGRLKLLDFGTAKIADAIEQITRQNEFIGTFAYASPEQVTGKPVSGQSDLYSLGILLYRLFSGVLPFQHNDPIAVARAQVNQAPRPIREIVPTLPVEIADVIHQLLAKAPEKRVATGSDVARRLENALGKAPPPPPILDVSLPSEGVLGREPAMVEIRALLDKPRPGGVALVVGQHGSGRDKMLDAALADAKSRGFPAFEIRFGADPAFAALAFLRERTAGIAEDSAAYDHVRTLTRLDPDLAGQELREQLKALGPQLLAEQARIAAKPVLVIARELHHATVEAGEILVAWAFGCARLTAPVMFLGGTSEDADDVGGMVRTALPHARRISLTPLDVHHTAIAVGTLLLRRPPPANVARRIHNASGGQPHYIEDVVRRMVQHGLLRAEGRDANRIAWAAREGLDVPISESARSRVLEALARLPADRRRVVEALALVGRDATVTEIAWYLEREPGHLAPALTDWRLRDLVAIESEGGHQWLRWRQRIAESAVLEQVHPARRALLQRRIAEIISDDTPITPAQTRTLVSQGLVADAVLRARIWADTQLQRGLPVTALEGTEPVVSHLATAEVLPEDAGWLYLLHAKALLLARPTDPETGRALHRAAALGDDPRYLAELALLRARVQRVIGHYANFRAQLAEAWAQVHQIGGAFDANVASLGATIAQETSDGFLLSGDLDQATQWSRESRAMALRAAAPHEHALADGAQAELQLVRGQIGAAEKGLAKVVKFADHHKHGDVLAEVLPPWAAAMRLQGRWTEALERLEATVPTYRSNESPSLYVRLLAAHAWVEVDLCRLGRAQELVDELFATLRRGEHLHLRLEADIVAARIHLASGNFQDAHDLTGTVVDRAQVAGLLPIAEHGRALQAEAAWYLGRYDEADAAFQRAVDAVAPLGDQLTLLDVCLARLRAASGSQNPNEIMAPIGALVQAEAVNPARLEWVLATGRFQRAAGADPKATYERAQTMLDRIAQKLDPTAQAALRVHPWSREIRVLGAVR